MSVSIGFVLLVNPFSRLGQSARLIDRLNAMFDFPPIAVHHDFGKNPNFIPDLPPNVRLVRPHINTKWADFTCIEAAIAALRLLYAGPEKPDWFVYLSGADYPIKPARTILQELKASPFDAHIQHLPLVYKHYPTWWQKISFKRVCSVRVRYPWITRHLQFTTRTRWLSHPFFTRGRLPYSDHFKPYAGEAWFCASRRAAEAILKFYERDVAFAQHCRQIMVPEETYFHTVLANDPSLKLSQDYLRYVDWSAGGSHPKVLAEDDLPKLLQTNAHFARKFPDAEKVAVLDELDRTLS
jgi:hypothetical protein